MSDRSESDGTVVTVGELMGLLLAKPGGLLGTATCFDLDVAGAEATVAIGLARLGHPTAFVGRLGRDPVGEQILRRVRAEGVDVTALALSPGEQTGLLLRDAPVGRPVTVAYYRHRSAASRLAPSDLPLQRIRTAACLHLTGITAALSASALETVVVAAEEARAHGVPVCFDPNVRTKLAGPARWRTVLEVMAPLADVVLTGTSDATAVTTGEPAAWFLDRGVRTVVVKDGENGSWEQTGTDVVRQPAVPTTAVDTVGAGDAFAAGWISAWLRGLGPAERLREAATVAALAVSAHGDLNGLPDAATRDRALNGVQEALR